MTDTDEELVRVARALVPSGWREIEGQVLIERILSALRSTRTAALEEAAKIADAETEEGDVSILIPSAARAVHAAVTTARRIASAIRSMRKGE